MKRMKTIKKIVSVLMALCLFMAEMPIALAAEDHYAVSEDLLNELGLTWEEFTAHSFEDTGETYRCVLWTKDIDMEPAVIYGIDEAEKTRKEPVENYNYPYEVYVGEDGSKDVVVNLSDDEDDEYVQTYIMAKREKASLLYEENNSAFVEESLKDYAEAITYVSHYSPCVFMELTVEQIYELSRQEDVYYLGFQGTTECENAALTDAEELDLPNMLNVVRANEATRTAYNTTGAGVYVGQYEGSCPSHGIKHPERSYYNSSNDDSKHADSVWQMIEAVAPGVTHLCSCRRLTNGSDAPNAQGGIEWLLDNGANILNFSCVWAVKNTYTDFARWFDHIAYNHDAHVVIAAGNDGDGGIGDPGMAYNIITVGNVDMVSPYDKMNSSSYNSYGPNRVNRRTFKPDLCATGNFTHGGGGTSFSAPLVTGAIALICQYRPALKTKQHIVKAILCASVKSSNHRYINRTITESYKKYGAGILDARAALYAVKVNRYAGTGVVDNSSTTATYSMNVTTSDTTKRVVLAYANRILLNGTSPLHPEQTAPAGSGHIGELKLEIYAPDGSFVVRCTTGGANVKVLNFHPENYGYGTYTIKVIQTVSADNPTRHTNFGLSWR